MARGGNTTQRGYGHTHRTERARWTPTVQAGNATCARCHRPIHPDTPWDLGHHDTDRTRWTGPEHRTCNRAAGARRGNHLRGQRRTRASTTSTPRLDDSRRW